MHHTCVPLCQLEAGNKASKQHKTISQFLTLSCRHKVTEQEFIKIYTHELHAFWKTEYDILNFKQDLLVWVDRVPLEWVSSTLSNMQAYAHRSLSLA